MRLFNDLLNFTRTLVQEKFCPLPADSDVSVEHWLATNTTYTLARKETLLAKHREMSSRDDPKIFHAKCFVKDEEYPEYKHSRCINSRSDEFKTLVGPIFHLIEKELFKRPEFIKYIPVPERPEYLMDRLYSLGAKYVETDYKACEAHFDDLRFEIEFIFYRYMTTALNGGADFMKLIKKALRGKNKCIFKEFTLWVDACRLSGEMNTSLGNGFVNWVLAEFTAFHNKAQGFAVVCEGDDGAIRSDPLPTAQNYKDLGFSIEAEPQSQISGMKFCGLIYDDDDRVNVTDPVTEILSFGWTNQRYVGAAHRTKMALLRAKSISMLYQYSGCPVLRSLALYGLRVTSGFCVDRIAKLMSVYERERFLEAYDHVKRHKFESLITKKIGVKTRMLVEERFGLRLDDQLVIEKHLDSLNDIRPLDIPVLRLYFKSDQTHYYANYVAEYQQESFDVSFYRTPPFSFPSLVGGAPEFSITPAGVIRCKSI